MPTAQLHVVSQPVCRHFLSKGMFITGLVNPAEDPTGPHGDGNCWCNQTQSPIGPDDAIVERETCTYARRCYEQR